MRQLWQTLPLAAAVAGLVGCATQRDFYEQAVKTNIAVEEAHNRILLLNVVRAFKRQPMHFTGFGKITGPAGSVSPAFGFTIPFGPDFTNNIYQFQPSFKPDVASYEIAIYDKQEFVRGFTTRVAPSLLEYLLDQGWPAELVLHLLVRTIDETAENGRLTRTYTNQPQDRKEFKEFQEWVRGAALCRITIENDPKPEVPVDDFVLAESNLPTGAAMLAMQEKGYVLKKKGDPDDKKPPTYQLVKREVSKVLKFSDRPGAKYACPAHLANPQGAAAGTGKPSAFHLRSPEAMVYYLGELARAQLRDSFEDGVPKGPWPVKINIAYREREGRIDCAPEKRQLKMEQKILSLAQQQPSGCPIEANLFNVIEGPALQDSDVMLLVQHDGVSYGIPRQDEAAGRSMHVLSLISQIIGLQKSATELPQSTTVRIIQ